MSLIRVHCSDTIILTLRGLKFYMTNHTTFFKFNYIANWFKIAIFWCAFTFQLAPIFCITSKTKWCIITIFHVFFNFHPNRFQHIVYSWASLNHKVKKASDTGSLLREKLCCICPPHCLVLAHLRTKWPAFACRQALPCMFVF